MNTQSIKSAAVATATAKLAVSVGTIALGVAAGSLIAAQILASAAKKD